jgi:MYXO-CTERM domain-containing protein
VVGGSTLCTGTLVHPEVVIYAAHCGTANKRIRFGEGSLSATSEHEVPAAFCKGYAEMDHAFCVLSTPVTEIPITPPVMGCEADLLYPGQEVAIAGFGKSCTGPSGTKRWAMTTVHDGPDDQARIYVGGGGVGPWSGDSGGPAFLHHPDGTWHAFGILSAGSACGEPALYGLMHPIMEWFESESGIDITPCHDADGTWNPTPQCVGFATDPLAEGLEWDDWCSGAPRSGPSATCGPPFSNEPDEEAPSVAIASPEDGDYYEQEPVKLTIEVAADDGDGWGIKEVALVVDGVVLDAVDTVPPFGFSNVTFPAGSYEIAAQAEDWAGNVGESEPVRIYVAVEPPAEDETEATEEGDSEQTEEGEPDSSDSDPEPDTEDGVEEEADMAGEGCGCAYQGSRSGGLGWTLVAFGLIAGSRRRRARVLT